MKTNYTLNAQERSNVGKGASRRLRRENRIPGIIYGAAKPSKAISLEHNEVVHALENESFYTNILNIDINGKTEKVILKDLQRHSYKPLITHVDFQRISEKEKITMDIPLHFIGEAIAPGVKQGGGLVSHLMTEVTVRCLPKNLPEFIEVDLSKLELNESIHLSDLILPKDIEIIALSQEDHPVVTIYLPRAAAEPTETATAPTTEEVATTTTAQNEENPSA